MEAHKFLLDEISRQAPVPCLGPDRDAWISDHPRLQEFAATRCFQCPVRPLCADYAREHEPHRSGVWGGMKPIQIRKSK